MNRFRILLLLCVSVSAAHAELVFHVSPKAIEGADGSVEKPFASIVAARDFIRAGRKDGKIPATEAVSVEIAAGIYQMEDSVEFTAEDGGTVGAPVTYRSAKKGEAQLRGGATLPASAFTKVEGDEKALSRFAESARGKIFVCDLEKFLPGELPLFPKSFRGKPRGPWLYVDGQSMTLARWPNKDAENQGWTAFTKVVDKGIGNPDSEDPAVKKAYPGAFVYENPRMANWDLDAGVWLLGYWTHDWYDENIRIGSYNKEKKVVRLAASHTYGIMGNTWAGAEGRRFFAQNLLAELDSPGEWYVDRAQKKLYYYPTKPITESEIVLAANTGTLLTFTGTKHLNLEGITLGYGHGHGISSKGVEYINISGCTLTNLAGSGITLRGDNCTIQSCDISNIGLTAVHVEGGDRKTLTPGNTLVENNHIHHYAIFQRAYAPGISVAGCGQIVRNNLIHHAPHNAIKYGGNEHLLELNEVHHVVRETGDSGAFYTGRSWTSQGNILRHNYIHDLGGESVELSNTMGIYLDDCASGDTIQGNIFHRAGRALLIGGGRDNPIRNNIILDCPIGMHMDARGMSWKQWNNPKYPSWLLEEKAKKLNYQSPPWSEKYPSLAKIMSDSPKEPLHNPITGNVFINSSETAVNFTGTVLTILPKMVIKDNIIAQPAAADAKIAKELQEHPGFSFVSDAPEDLGFVDVAKGDLSLKEGSWLLEKAPGLKEIPFKKIGLYKDQWRTELP